MSDGLQHRPAAETDSRQFAIYGASWADRLGRLLRGYRIPQSRLASVIGLSAPMISQLISGQRVKISNPVVYGRIVRLEELLTDPAIATGDPVAISTALEQVSADNPVLTTRQLQVSLPDAAITDAQLRQAMLAQLRHLADQGQLQATAQAAHAHGAGQLAELLFAAARLDG